MFRFFTNNNGEQGWEFSCLRHGTVLIINYYHTCIFCLKPSGAWYPILTYLKGLPIHHSYKLCAIKKRETNCIKYILIVSLWLCMKTKSAVLLLNIQLLVFSIINAVNSFHKVTFLSQPQRKTT